MIDLNNLLEDKDNGVEAMKRSVLGVIFCIQYIVFKIKGK